MVHSADHTSCRIEQDVQVDHCQCHLLPDHPEQDEDVGDHDGREELEEVLDPQMHDPEAPEVRGGEVRLRPGEQPDGIECRDRQGREEEEPRHVAHVLPPEPSAHRPEEHRNPEEEAYREQYLPKTPEIEVLKTLVAEPRPE